MNITAAILIEIILFLAAMAFFFPKEYARSIAWKLPIHSRLDVAMKALRFAAVNSAIVSFAMMFSSFFIAVGFFFVKELLITFLK